MHPLQQHRSHSKVVPAQDRNVLDLQQGRTPACGLQKPSLSFAELQVLWENRPRQGGLLAQRKTCENCENTGHTKDVCRPTAVKKPPAAPDAGTATQKDPTLYWICFKCDATKHLVANKCPGCHTKRVLDPVADKVLAPLAPKAKKDDNVVQQWAQAGTNGNGIPPPSLEQVKQQAEITVLEQMIALTQQRDGKEDEVKKLQAELATAHKKLPANTVSKDIHLIARSAKEAEEKHDRKVTVAEEGPRKKWRTGRRS